jgi:hypothetical protein
MRYELSDYEWTATPREPAFLPRVFYDLSRLAFARHARSLTGAPSVCPAVASPSVGCRVCRSEADQPDPSQGLGRLWVLRQPPHGQRSCSDYHP